MQYTRLAITVALGLLIPGCFSVDRPYPEKRQFTLSLLDREPDPDATGEPIPGILQVRRLQISSPYSEPELIYRVGKREVQTDFYNVFIAPPDELIQVETRRYLQAVRLFEEVVSRDSLLQPTHYLEGVVSTIHGDFRDASRPRAVIEVQFMISRDRAGEVQAAGHWRLREEIEIADTRPESVIEGLNEGLYSILTRLAQTIRSLSPD